MDFFLIGHQRSGTTLLRTLLNSQGDVFIPTESHFLTDVFRHCLPDLDSACFGTIIKRHPRLSEWNLGILENLGAARNLNETVDALFRAQAPLEFAGKIGDKTPEYLSLLPVLGQQFPDAKVLLLIRDGRDVVLSLENRGWQGPFLENRMEYWSNGCRQMNSFLRSTGSKRSLLIQYEALVKDPQIELAKVRKFLGLPAIELQEDPKFDASAFLTATEKERGIHESLGEGRIQDRSRCGSIRPSLNKYMTFAMGSQLKKFGYVLEYESKLFWVIRLFIMRVVGVVIMKVIPDSQLYRFAMIKRRFLEIKRRLLVL